MRKRESKRENQLAKHVLDLIKEGENVLEHCRLATKLALDLRRALNGDEEAHVCMCTVREERPKEIFVESYRALVSGTAGE